MDVREGVCDALRVGGRRGWRGSVSEMRSHCSSVEGCDLSCRWAAWFCGSKVSETGGRELRDGAHFDGAIACGFDSFRLVSAKQLLHRVGRGRQSR